MAEPSQKKKREIYYYLEDLNSDREPRPRLEILKVVATGDKPRVLFNWYYGDFDDNDLDQQADLTVISVSDGMYSFDYAEPRGTWTNKVVLHRKEGLAEVEAKQAAVDFGIKYVRTKEKHKENPMSEEEAELHFKGPAPLTMCIVKPP